MNNTNKEIKQGRELLNLSHISLLATILVFSLVLIALNITLGWEKWTIPVISIFIAGVLYMHITRTPDDRPRIYIFGIILMVEMFYYCANINTAYDTTPVIIVILVILIMSREKPLYTACLFTGFGGMIYNFYNTFRESGFEVTSAAIVRTILHFLLVGIAGFVTIRLSSVLERIEKQYAANLHRLEDENRSAGDFLTNLSHEIRTPVNVILGMTDICLQNENDEGLKNAMSSVLYAGKQVADQIDDIMDYSEIDKDSVSVTDDDYMIASVVNDIITSLYEAGDSVKKDGVDIIVDVDAAVPYIMNSDAKKISKILRHLIYNALKYTNEGGIYVRIHSVKQNYGANLCIEVTDTGVGMTKTEMEHAFDRFYQSDSGRTRSTRGLGLGLAIVAGFVDSLNGFASIESRKGEGTTMRISVPQAVVDDSPCIKMPVRENICIGSFINYARIKNANVRDFYNTILENFASSIHSKLYTTDDVGELRTILKKVSLTHLFIGANEYYANSVFIEEVARKTVVIVVADRGFALRKGSRAYILRKPLSTLAMANMVSRETEEDEAEGNIKFPGVRALVVDDEGMNLEVASRILERYGCIVTTAASGRESIDLCATNDFDVVFMDHMMPKMDGVEAMKHLKHDSIKRRKELPVIALTANASSTAKEMFLKEGFDGFIPKPIDLSELERAMKKVLPEEKIEYEEPKEEDENSFFNHPRKGRLIEVKPMRAILKEEPKAVEQKAETASSYTFVDALKDAGVDVTSALSNCQNDKDFYRDLLSRFVKEGRGKIEDIEYCAVREELEDYTTLVHGLKSTAKLIGVNDLSEHARIIEEAGKNKDTELIKQRHDELMEEYHKYINIISGVLKNADR